MRALEFVVVYSTKGKNSSKLNYARCCSCSHRAYLVGLAIVALILTARGASYFDGWSLQSNTDGDESDDIPKATHESDDNRKATPAIAQTQDSAEEYSIPHEELQTKAKKRHANVAHTEKSSASIANAIENKSPPLAFTCGMDDPNLNEGRCCLAGRLKCLLSALFRRERAGSGNLNHPAGYLREKWPNFLSLFNNPELLVSANYQNQSRVDTARLLTERRDVQKKLKCPANLHGSCTTSTDMLIKPKQSKKERWHGGGCVDFCLCHIPPKLVATYYKLASVLRPVSAVKAAVDATLKRLPASFLGVYWRPPGKNTPHWARGSLREKEPSIYTFTMAMKPLCQTQESQTCKLPIFLAVRAHDGGFAEEVHRKNAVRAMKEEFGSTSIVCRHDDPTMSAEQNSLVDLLVLKNAAQLVVTELADFSDLAWLLGGGQAKVVVPGLTSVRGLPGAGESCWQHGSEYIEELGTP